MDRKMKKIVMPFLTGAVLFASMNGVSFEAHAATPKEVSPIGGGAYHSMVIKNDGTVWTWGLNPYGIGSGSSMSSSLAIKVSNLSNIVSVDSAQFNSLALKDDGTVWSWGSNFNGEIGDGTTVAKSTPVQVVGLNDVIAVEASTHSLALKSDGTVWGWGLSAQGQLGGATTATESLIPVNVPNLSNVISISADGGMSMALKADGTVWTWGVNDKGQLGNGSLTNSSTPQQVPGLENVIAIDAAVGYAMAVKSDGSVWAWGDNQYGALGNGTFSSSSTPVKVVGLENVVAVNAGQLHSMALKEDGTVWAWGDNRYGQLGDSTTVVKATPIQVPGLANVTSIEAGSGFSMALQSDGSLWMWGMNGNNQLGDGKSASRNAPYQLMNISDVTPPAPVAYSADKTMPTNTNVTVTITPPSDALVTQYKIGATGSWRSYTAPFLMSSNNTIYARSTDGAGNVSAESSFVVNNIDKVKPTLTLTSTYKTINISTSDALSGVKRIKLPDGTYVDGASASYTVPNNGTYTVEVEDNAGNVTSGSITIEVNNPPVVNEVLPDRTVSLDSDPFTVDMSNVFSDPDGNVVTTTAISVDESIATVVKDGNILTITPKAPGTVRIHMTGSDGSMTVTSKFFVTVQADTTAPNPASIVADKTNATNEDVTVTISYPSDAETKEYRIDNGAWATYTAPVVMSQNGTIYARSADAAGNNSEETSYVVSNIDKISQSAPVVTFPSNDVVVNSATAVTLKGSSVEDGGLEIIYGLVNDTKGKSTRVIYAGDWTVFFSGGRSAIPLKEGKNEFNLTYIDNAGNRSETTTHYITLDTIVPTAPQGSLVNGNAVTITPGTDNIAVDSTLYQLNGGEWTKHDGNPLTLVDGNYTLNMKTIDKAGNESSVQTFEFSITVSLDKVKTAVTRAENTPAWSYVNAAQIGLSTLAPSSEKTALEVRLNKVIADLTLFDSISNEITTMNNDLNTGNASLAELSEYKVRVEDHRDSVDTLPNTMNKTSLHNQLNELGKKLILVETVLKTNSDGDVTEIDLGTLQDQINELPDGELKDQLQEQLEQAKDYQDANDIMAQAEQSKTQADVDKAKDAISQLPDGPIKDALNDRLNSVQEEINNVPETNEPYGNIDSIKDPVVKATLTDVERYVGLGEKYKTKTWIVSALNKVEAMPDSIKSNPLYSVIVKDLTDRANKLKEEYNNGIADQETQQKITTATNYVAMYEKYKSSYYKTKAQTSVDALPESEVKISLQARINAVVAK